MQAERGGGEKERDRERRKGKIKDCNLVSIENICLFFFSS